MLQDTIKHIWSSLEKRGCSPFDWIKKTFEYEEDSRKYLEKNWLKEKFGSYKWSEVVDKRVGGFNIDAYAEAKGERYETIKLFGEITLQDNKVKAEKFCSWIKELEKQKQYDKGRGDILVYITPYNNEEIKTLIQHDHKGYYIKYSPSYITEYLNMKIKIKKDLSLKSTVRKGIKKPISAKVQVEVIKDADEKEIERIGETLRKRKKITIRKTAKELKSPRLLVDLIEIKEYDAYIQLTLYKNGTKLQNIRLKAFDDITDEIDFELRQMIYEENYKDILTLIRKSIKNRKLDRKYRFTNETSIKYTK